MTKSKTMTKGNTLALILSFSLPLLLGNIFQQTYNLVDTAIVGKTLGYEALAAVGATSSVQFLVLGFCQGLCLGFTIPIGQRYGAKDEEGLHKFIFHGHLLAVTFAIVLTVLTTLSTSLILHLLQVPQDIYKNTYAYIFGIFLEIPFAIMYNWLAGMMRAIGDSKTPFLFLAVASLLNIVLDFVCIINFHWGVAGRR